jgi:hypothetical protein
LTRGHYVGHGVVAAICEFVRKGAGIIAQEFGFQYEREDHYLLVGSFSIP